MNVISVQTSTLRKSLADVLDSIEKKSKDYLLILTKNKPKAALVNLDFLEDLLAKNNPEYLKDIKKSREEISKGNFLTHDQLFGEL